ncbi:MAG TPA: M28 family metallopeptidase, partial [Saprospiraceae bacterium]|nr:M28 family metallopeptidase [Saprospiraceae bacterium]
EAKRIGLAPGNGDSFTQDVPLTEITGHPDSTLDLMGANQVSLHLGTEYVGYTQRPEEEILISGSDVVFCGFGVTAPEVDWDDYAGTDVTGKTVILLVNDPDYGTSDSTRFKGKAMTYYGRWTYKYEAAARHGAAAVFIVHETNAAGYPWNVVREASTGSKLNLQNLPYTPCQMQGWISTEAAEKIFTAADLDFKKAKIAAQRPGFKAMPLPFKANVKLHNEIKNNASKNVIALLPGTDKKDEYVIFSAHWDHFGISTPVNGDSIYNGAVDNASGSAALLAIAEAMKAGCPYQRSIVFLWVTAEEQGLLGSAYYAAHPVFPPAKTVADLNIDALNDFGEMKDLSIVGYGQSELEDYAKRWAEKQGRYILPDQEPEKGYFFRSDHFNFAKIGIPALFASGEHDQKEKGVEYAKAREEEYRTHRYHQPADEYHGDSFDVSGMLQDATLYMEVAAELANNGEWPKWKPGSEFKAIREKVN